MSIDQHSKLILKSSTKTVSNSEKKQKTNCNKNLVLIYVLLGILCFATIAIATIFVYYVNRINDLSVLRPNLKNDLIVNDIKHIVRSVLKDVENECSRSKSYVLSKTTSEQNTRKMNRMEHIMREKREIRTLSNKVYGTQNEDQSKKFVEFFNPKIRRELEKKDEEFKKAYGYKGAAPGGDEWVWLTSYCRIPYESITGFCSATKDYCPAGPAGIPGLPGAKGYKGDIGIPGPPGPPGRVSRGPKGMPGSPGLDGRDGIPGEPGLDGVPGRAGEDGIPGKDGIPGINGKDGIPGIPGRNGRDGKDGKDGKEGPIGPQGRQGPPGEMGIAGPRGPTGEPGFNGTDGIPGINAHKVTVNGTLSNEFLIPPYIVGSNDPQLKRPIIVYEGDHLRLRCAASGVPFPNVEWRRKDFRTTSLGAWQASSIPGHTLNFTKINRVHMGTYECVANNGIPPAARATFSVEIYFAPLIFIRNQYLYAAEGGSVFLECEIEAFPEAIQFWKRKSDNRVLYNSAKYKMDTKIDSVHRYKSTMQLNITRMQKDDYGEYLCVSKNEVNTTTAVIYINDKMKPPNRAIDLNAIAIFGPSPPNLESYEDICGPKLKCDKTETSKDSNCKNTIANVYDLVVANLEIKNAENRSFALFNERKVDCVLYAVGKPIYQNFTDWKYGSWLKDPLPRVKENDGKIWVTNPNNTLYVYEYDNQIKYRKNETTKPHKLDSPGYQGNAHVVYNGSFYYQEKNTDQIVRYDLETRQTTTKKSLYKAAASGPNFLYTTNHSYMDFNVDENGLWVIYATADSNHTHVAKLEPYSLEAQYNWNISVNHHKVGEMFIVCGVLYAIDSVSQRYTKIRLALDLYHNKILHVEDLTFTNPFTSTTTVGYNHQAKELYSWDGGNQLTYPVRYHQIGYNISSTHRAGTNSELKTGFDITPAKKRN